MFAQYISQKNISKDLILYKQTKKINLPIGFQSLFYKRQPQTQQSILIDDYFQCYQRESFIINAALCCNIFSLQLQPKNIKYCPSQAELAYINKFEKLRVVKFNAVKQIKKQYKSLYNQELVIVICYQCPNTECRQNIILSNSGQIILTIANIQKFNDGLIRQSQGNINLQFENLGKVIKQKFKLLRSIIIFEITTKKQIKQIKINSISRILQIDIQILFGIIYLPKYKPNLEKNRYFIQISTSIQFSKAYVIQAIGFIMISNKIINQQKQSIIQNNIYKFLQLNNFIRQKIFSTSKFDRNFFQQNQICIQLYSLCYNYLSKQNINFQQNYYQEDIQKIQNNIINLFFQSQKKFIYKQQHSQKKSHFHYPIRIIKKKLKKIKRKSSSQKQSDNDQDKGMDTNSKKKIIQKKQKLPQPSNCKCCTVCLIDYRISHPDYREKQKLGQKQPKKKTAYKCQGCSQIYGRDVPLCVLCFKKFHQNVQKYIPYLSRKKDRLQRQSTILKSFVNCSKINHQFQQIIQSYEDVKRQIKEDDSHHNRNYDSISQITKKWKQIIQESDAIFKLTIDKLSKKQKYGQSKFSKDKLQYLRQQDSRQ